MNSAQSRQTYSDKIDLVMDYIYAHLSEELSLETLASVACFSPFHFHRIFLAITGETPRDYIERCKLERAANRLCTAPERSVLETALECGYSSVSVFSRAFKKHYRIAPSAFLKKHIHDYHSIDAAESKRQRTYTEDDFATLRFQNLPACHYAYKQVFSGYSSGIPISWSRLLCYAESHDLLEKETVYFGIPFDNPGITPRDKCRYRACITVGKSFVQQKGEIRTAEIQAARYVLYPFKGRREDISDAYALLYGGWLPQSGYIPDDKPTLELYPPDLHRGSADVLEYTIALPIMPI
jgi:AraC family transcriptional regulator